MKKKILENFLIKIESNNNLKKYIEIIDDANKWGKQIIFNITKFYNLARIEYKKWNYNISENFLNEWINIFKLLWNVIINYINTLRKAEKYTINKIETSKIIKKIEELNTFFKNILENFEKYKEGIKKSWIKEWNEYTINIFLYNNINDYINKKAILICNINKNWYLYNNIVNIYKKEFKRLEFLTWWFITTKNHNKDIYEKIKEKLYFWDAIPTIK